MSDYALRDIGRVINHMNIESEGVGAFLHGPALRKRMTRSPKL
jgi:hypothetical protein